VKGWKGVLVMKELLLLMLLADPLSRPLPQQLQTPDLTCRVRDSTGKPIRSMARRAMFLRMIGYPDGKVPKGFDVDHIIPLTCGGCDVPSSMELLPEAVWKAKSRWERQPCSGWWDGTYIRMIQKEINSGKGGVR
jgi:hypothetical protein